MTSINTTQDTVRVLVVDDEWANRLSVGKTLERAGYIVDDAANGEEALEKVRQNEYEVILTDIRMSPNMDGIELLRRIKEQYPDAIVILMTGYASLSTAVEALRLGAHDYLVKPSSGHDIRQSVARGVERAQNLRRRRKLLETIRSDVNELVQAETLSQEDSELKLVDSAPANDDAQSALSAAQRLPVAMQLGALTVYPGRYQVALGNEPVELTPTEFELLVYLAAHRGRIVPCHELVREVRGYTVEEAEAREVIRPHVSNLRRKLKEANGADIVENVRGVGYRISERI